MTREEKLKELEDEIAKLKEEHAEQLSLSEDRQLAEFLHDKLCKWNHVDGCGWFYYNWTDPGQDRTVWINKARRVLKVVDIDTAKKVVNLL